MTREESITEITRRLVAYYQPESVYLFGSAARGLQAFTGFSSGGYGDEAAKRLVDGL